MRVKALIKSGRSLNTVMLECGKGNRNSWCSGEMLDIRRNTDGESGFLGHY